MASTTASHMNPDQAEHPPLHQDVGLQSLTVYHRFRFTDLLATRASGPHPFPFRTRTLSPTAPMVLRSRDRGSVGRRRRLCEPSPLRWAGFFFYPSSIAIRLSAPVLAMFSMNAEPPVPRIPWTARARAHQAQDPRTARG